MDCASQRFESLKLTSNRKQPVGDLYALLYTEEYGVGQPTL